VLGFWCVSESRNPRSLSLQWTSSRSTGIYILLIDLVSLSPQGRQWATNSDKALQRCCSSCLLLLLSSRAGLIQINLLMICLHLCCPHDENAAGTARRPRACAQANCSDHAPARKRTRARIWALAAGARSHLPKYVHIHANTVKYLLYICDTDMSVYDTDISVSYTYRDVSCTYVCTYPVHRCTYVLADTFKYISSYLTKSSAEYVLMPTSPIPPSTPAYSRGPILT
jgi:hypothetical protein